MKAISLSVYSFRFEKLFLFAATLLAVFLFSTSLRAAPAHHHSVTAEGKVIYKKKDGQLVERVMTLEVPARGQGDVVLRGGGLELRTKGFSTEKVAGRTIFRVEFASAPGAPEGTQMLLEGTYMRDQKLAIYYGDVYGRNPQMGQNDWSHVGGFKFKTPAQ